MSSGLNVIALISGGKDSLYSILHCLKNGHNVVALANLHPPVQSQNNATQTGAGENEEEDIDSFMYQTIGHSVIPLYQEALGVPLYRAPILGGAVDSGRVYRVNTTHNTDSEGEKGDEEEDETESLIPLLRKVKQAHPEANAVSAGAILSTYQRTRIENVAGRLGLVPLAWLWQYPSLPPTTGREMGLLDDMASAGCSVRIIKVASGGLDEGFLWEDVSDPKGMVRRRMIKGMRRFAGRDIRGAVLGEGGEYESLAVDGPGCLWRGRIVFDEVGIGRGEGGVGFVRFRGASVVPKEKEEGEEEGGLERVRRPGLLDEVFEGVLGEVTVTGGEEATIEDVVDPCKLASEPTQSKSAGTWTVSNITAPEAGPGTGEQMEGIARKMHSILESSGKSSDDIIFATVLLRSMTDFALMNSVYVSMFNKPNPPARAAVACGDKLPERVNIMVSFVVDLGSRDARQGLHVQSRSYWAPANIGPYSQAMSIPLQTGGTVYIAGQIPLEPASMEIVSSRSWTEDYPLRAVLSLQHLWRIGEAMQVDWWLGVVAYLTGGDLDNKAQYAWRLWKRMHQRNEGEEDDGPVLDAWDIKYGRQTEEISDASATIPNFSVVQSGLSTPPFFAVQVEELPRGSDIEWQGLGCQCDDLSINVGEMNDQRTIETSVNDTIYTGIEISQPANLKSCLQHIRETYRDSHAVVYTAQSVPEDWPGQIVPSKAVWGRDGGRLAAGVILYGSK